ncbi:DRMBL-domain-containing protein [Neoconidiobolus thromboides FSU 785]|nr:DRMBL-domain-containing protein [Neoconidiobolus thromboides FSU 785]
MLISKLLSNIYININNIYSISCPGSVLFLFEVPYDDNIDHSNPNKFTRILHCGDFRVHKDIHLNENSILSKIPLDYLYLDTTYCNPSYSFPSQKQVIDKSIILANEFISLSSTTDKLKNSIFNYFSSTSKPKKNIGRIIAVGSYSIGKERIFLNIAKQLKTKVYVTQAKFQILMNFMDINLNNILTLDPTEAKVHILPMNQINAKSLKEYFEQIKLINPNLNSILGIKPTGWTFSNKYANQDNPPSKIDLNNLKPSSICDKVTIYGLPYSEHSSFEELRSFVKHIAKVSKNNNKNLKVIPTVKPANMDPLEVLEYLNEWAK